MCLRAGGDGWCFAGKKTCVSFEACLKRTLWQSLHCFGARHRPVDGSNYVLGYLRFCCLYIGSRAVAQSSRVRRQIMFHSKHEDTQVPVQDISTVDSMLLSAAHAAQRVCVTYANIYMYRELRGVDPRVCRRASRASRTFGAGQPSMLTNRPVPPPPS